MQTILTRLLPAGSILALTAGMLATLAYLHTYPVSQLARHSLSELEKLSDEEAIAQLPQIVSLGEAALPALCYGLGSARPKLADAIEATLLDELVHWELLAPQDAGQKLSCLAEALTKPSPNLTQDSLERRARLAQRILAWPQPGLLEMPQIIAHCERVLQAAAPIEGEPQLLPDTSQARPLQSVADSMRSMPAAVAPAVETHPLAADQDYVDFVDEPREQRPAEALPDLKRLAAPSTELAAPQTLPVDMSTARPIKDVKPTKPSEAAEPTPSRTPNPLRQTRGLPAASLSDRNHIPLAQLLHSSDASLADAAREELVRRGHSPPVIELSQRLTDPKPAVRARAAEDLLQLGDVDARPWLLWFSHDESPQVRLVAVTLMATSRESRMLRRVKEMASSDADQRVRTQAQKALR